MSDALGRILLIIFGVYLLFIVPIVCITQNTDNATQTYIQDVTEEFVNKAAKTGQISKESYENFINELDATGNLYNIDIIHEYKSVNPDIDEETMKMDKEGNVSEGYIARSNSEIFEALESDGVFYLNNGDYVAVNVKSESEPIGSKMLHFLGIVSEYKLYGKFGSYVEHEQTHLN